MPSVSLPYFVTRHRVARRRELQPNASVLVAADQVPRTGHSPTDSVRGAPIRRRRRDSWVRRSYPLRPFRRRLPHTLLPEVSTELIQMP